MAPINVNIGILGHIDSGKTSLCRALSTIVSTASMDKAPESQARGITLDLGFSSFSTDAPEHFKEKNYDTIQFCLVDCPGHASLIRTVIGGAQIIDLCCLVIDANKGIQTQTAECLVVAEILANQLVIILNKIDMIPQDEREKKLATITKRLRMTFAKTKFGHDLPFACTAASPGDSSPSIGIDGLVDTLKSIVRVPQRDFTGPFIFSYDHCFPIKGQGTVLTGTVLSGSVKPKLNIELPMIGEPGKGKQVRSLQMFKKPVNEAFQGDRVAICVAGLDAKELERGIMCDTKTAMQVIDSCICVVDRISYFKSTVKTKAKFHISMGHQTVMGSTYFFFDSNFTAGAASSAANGVKEGEKANPSLNMGCGALVADRQKTWPTEFDWNKTYQHLDDLFQVEGGVVEYEDMEGNAVKFMKNKDNKLEFHLNGTLQREVKEFFYEAFSGRLKDQDGPIGLSIDSKGIIPIQHRERVLYLLCWMAKQCSPPVSGLPESSNSVPTAYCLLEFEKPVMCPPNSLFIGSKLDFETNSPQCRMAFFGRILCKADSKNLKALQIIKMKQKTGTLDRMDKQDKTVVVCKDMFKADTDLSLFQNLKVVHQKSGLEGVMDGAFGKTGKFRVRFQEEPPVSYDAKGNVKGGEKIGLFFKKFVFDNSKKFVQ